MATPPTPSTLRVGDTVFVPGEMHGTLKFIGLVAGKRGTFAGVQLAPEYAARGKNSGDVDGRYYFKTTVSGSGIFLPLEKATRMDRAASGLMTPKTPGGLSNFNLGGRAVTPAGGLGTLPKPNFSQSVGGGGMRPMSPMMKGAGNGLAGRRESLPRPTSPLRKVQVVSTPTPVGKLTTPKTRPSLGMKNANGNTPQYRASPAMGRSTSKFSQSLRQSMVTPIRGSKLSPLGPEASFDEEEADAEATPTPTPAQVNAQVNAAAGKSEEQRIQSEGEISRLKESLEERDRQLKDQAGSIMEMEKSLAELQSLLPSLELGGAPAERQEADEDAERLPTDVVALRATVREKNDKIKVLTAEFDANRADFRSTIDTLEMASSETERVYEKRVDELLEEVRGLQDRSEDVAGLAEQMRQLEELVQELEEGLEDARRGEAEARGEVEFLRGEVERGRAEVRRLREGVGGDDSAGGADMEEMEEMRSVLEQRDDEIKGLKAIIHEMNRKSTEFPAVNGNHAKTQATVPAANYRVSRELERQITELKAMLSKKSDREEELENEVSRLRSNSFGRYPPPPPLQSRNSGSGNVSEKHKSAGTNGSHRLSDRTVIPSSLAWHDASSTPGSPDKRTGSQGHTRNMSQSQGQRSLAKVDEKELLHDQDYAHENDHEDSAKSTSGVTDTSSASLWCEICEEGGHDILTCGNMFGDNGGPPKSNGRDAKRKSSDSQRSGRDVAMEGLRKNHDDDRNKDRPAPLSMGLRKFSSSEEDGTPRAAPSTPLPPPPVMMPALPKPDENQAGMVAGKTSGVIDADRWCALCERDGHESVDCPFEDAF